LEIDEYAAKIVRRVFELFKNQESARSIADKLNCEGVLVDGEKQYAIDIRYKFQNALELKKIAS
jgi:hypothetical protein